MPKLAFVTCQDCCTRNIFRHELTNQRVQNCMKKKEKKKEKEKTFIGEITKSNMKSFNEA